MSSTTDRSEILCVGEVLWDSLPAGLFLGGAPFNVAGHLHSLGVPVGVVSRVGQDRLGAEALQRLARNGIDTDLVQVDPALPTGFVSVTVDCDGIPAYDIVKPAAWDHIELREGLLERAAEATAIVFGSLAQRDPVSRATIERLCEVNVPKVFDVNLRPPYDDPGIVRHSLAHADVVKLNEHELRQMAAWFGLPAGLREGTAVLAERFGCGTICVTRGGAGAVLLHRGRWSEHPGYRVEVKDTVGSGDAFLAAFLSGLLAGHEDEAILQHANLLGAYVATQYGAIPVYQQETLALILAVNQPPPLPLPPVAADAVFFQKNAQTAPVENAAG
ncbi:MAG TPA: carbohydrate kinase [Gemmatimonadaceae bacterium]|nr:carbohydrate kinase [Gemmatimonadaceae bacterium]